MDLSPRPAGALVAGRQPMKKRPSRINGSAWSGAGGDILRRPTTSLRAREAPVAAERRGAGLLRRLH